MFENLKSKITIKNVFLFSVICHLIAVVFSEGFHRPDEHLGVINMMGFKLGIIPKEDLSWEYGAQIRTWLQPYIYFVIAKTYFLFSHNPFYLALVLRLASSCLGLYSIWHFSKVSKFFIKDSQINYYFCVTLFCFWFFPFFHARTTTENFSSSFLILGLVPVFNFYFDDSKNIKIGPTLIAGFLLGLSFVFRFQTAMAFVFPVLLTLKKGPQGKKFFFTATSVIILTVALNTYIDYLGHEQWSFTPWNYVYQNIFLKVASGFGVSPWYFYLTKTFLESGPPLGILLILGPILLLFLNPLNLCNFVIWPFFIIHSLIGHKELRFIFPLLPFCLLALFCLIEIKCESLKRFFSRRIFKIFISICLLFNFSLLAISIFRPAFGPIKMYKYIYYSNEEIEAIYTLGVFRDQLHFYLKKPFVQIEINLSESMKMIQAKTGQAKALWFLTDKIDERNEILTNKICSEKYLSYPEWAFRFDFFNWIKRSKVWSLIKCQ